jgi:hypothetical protein
MFLSKKKAEDEAEDRNAAKPQLKNALYRRVGVSGCRRIGVEVARHGWLAQSLFQIPRVRCIALVFLG